MTQKRDLEFFKRRARVMRCDLVSLGVTWDRILAMLERYAQRGRPSNVWLDADDPENGPVLTLPYEPDLGDMIDALSFVAGVTGRCVWDVVDEVVDAEADVSRPWPIVGDLTGRPSHA